MNSTNNGTATRVHLSYYDEHFNNKNLEKWWDLEEYSPKISSFVSSHVIVVKNRWLLNYKEMHRHFRRYEYKMNALFEVVDPYTKSLQNRSLGLNITASVIDTLLSKITKNTPTIEFQPNSADQNIADKAKRLHKYVTGHFRFCGLDKIASQAVKDSYIFGSGFVHIKKNKTGDNVCYERVKPYEIIVDLDDAGINEKPVELHIVRQENKLNLIKRFPEHRDKIINSTNNNPFYSSSSSRYNKEMTVVIDSYNIINGRHVLSCNNCVLLDEKFEYYDKYGNLDYPLVKIDYKEANKSFFSIGLAEEVSSIQNELNSLIASLQRSTRICSTPKFFVPLGSDIPSGALNNEEGGIIPFKPVAGFNPQMVTFGGVSSDLYNQIQMFWQKGHEVCGLSQLSTSSQIPAGMNQASGRALETYYQIESDRFQNIGQNYENLYVELYDKTIQYMKMLSKNGELKESKYYSTELNKTICWDDVDLERDQYDIQVYPVSIIPSTPAGKRQFVNEMMSLGLLDKVTAQKLLKIPDSDGYLDLQNAQYDYILNDISKIMKGEEVEPDMNLDFELAKNLAINSYLMYSKKEVDVSCLVNLQAYINQITALSMKREAEQQMLMQQYMIEQQAKMQVNQ